MWLFLSRIFLTLCATQTTVHAVKVNMQGAVSLGRDVIETINYYLQNNGLTFTDGRRTLNRRSNDSEAMTWLVRYSYLCKGVPLCENDKPIDDFINTYVTAQIKAVEMIIYGALGAEAPQSFEPPTRAAFEEHAKDCLSDIREFIEEIGEDKLEYKQYEAWLDLVKKISATIQTKTVTYMQTQLDASNEGAAQIKRNLTSRIILGTILVEVKYEVKLCKELQVCAKTYEVTTGLTKLLESFLAIPDQKLRTFLKAFYQCLYDTKLYTILNDMTRQELQFVLNDMAFSNNIAPKTVLSSLQQAVQKRLNVLQGLEDEVPPDNFELQLVNIILSDMDHIYLHGKKSTFHNFNKKYQTWTETGGDVKKPLQIVLHEMANELDGKTPCLKNKLINEVQLFLRLTIGND